MSYAIRNTRPQDRGEIRALVSAAFERTDEADLVDRLRRAGDALVELVAEEDGGLVGHILFSPVRIERPASGFDAAALAPVCVIPGRWRRGVGGALIRVGIDRCKEFGLGAVLVLGHRAYYPRFGFSAQSAEALEAPFRGPSFMALELVPGALAQGGRAHYAAAFGV
jgi:putative acetyltransferase